MRSIWIMIWVCMLYLGTMGITVAQDLAYKPFEKAVYSQRFYSDGKIVYRRPHTVVLQCRTNDLVKGGLIMKVTRALFPSPGSDPKSTARFSSTEFPYTSRGVEFEKGMALGFDALSVGRVFPIFPSERIKAGDKWDIKAPPILYDWEHFGDVEDRKTEVKHQWKETVEKNGYQCADIEITIADEYVDSKSGTHWSMIVTGRVLFAIHEGLPVWEEFKVKLIWNKGGKEVIQEASRMAFLVDYEKSPQPRD